MNIYKKLFIFLTIVCIELHAQNHVINPLEFEPILSGTFGELRSNHFHAGLDIKTKGKEGAKILAYKKGYVSRIKVSNGGYGKAIYIKHPDGYTSVYAHLQKYSNKIDSLVKSIQYKKKSYQIEYFPKITEIIIPKDSLIGYTGNTGGSSGPHLHFEIRDENQKPLNPLKLGVEVQDNIKPILKDLIYYNLSKNNEIIRSKKINFYKNNIGEFISDTIYDIGKIGIGINVFDKQNLANNNNGAYQIITSIIKDTLLIVDYSSFTFNESKHINRHIDFAEYKKTKKRFQKLFIQRNNPLSIFKKNINKGTIDVVKDSSSNLIVEIFDFKKNKLKLLIPFKGNKTINQKLTIGDSNKLFINRFKEYRISNMNSTIHISKNTFYNNLFLDITSQNDILKINEDTIPLLKPIKIKFKKPSGKNNYVGKLNGNRISFLSSFLKNDSIIANSKSLGKFTMTKDTISPTINTLGLKNEQWVTDKKYLNLRILDNSSGVKNFRATINEKWILLEPYKKNGYLRYDFNDNISKKTKNELVIEVIDNAGNFKMKKIVFYRKIKD